MRFSKPETWIGVVGAVMIVVFIWVLSVSGFLYGVSAGEYLSPDERVLSTVITQSQAGRWIMPAGQFFVALAQVLSPIRTGIVMHNFVVPVGFAGWTGWLVLWQKIVSPEYIPMVLLLCIGSALVVLLRRQGSVHSLRWSVFLMGLLTLAPPIAYYLTRPLFVNLTVTLLWVLGVVLWLLASDGWRLSASIPFSVLSVATAVAIRPVEAIWIVPVSFILLYAIRLPYGVMSWIRAYAKSFVVTLFGVALIFGSVFWYQQQLTGSFLPGYIPVVSVAANRAPSLLDYIMPFGLHPRVLLANAVVMIVSGGLWMLLTVLITAGSMREMRWRVWLIPLTVSSAVFWYYGSWLVSDTPSGVLGPTSSFMRYTMPVFASLWVVLLLSRPWRLRRHSVLYVAVAGLLIAAGLFGDMRVPAPMGWGVKDQEPVLREQTKKRDAVMHVISSASTSVVFSRIADKWLWPDVMVFQPPAIDMSDGENSALWKKALDIIPADVPAWWYDFCRSENISSAVRAWESADKKECLYRITR